MSNVSASKTQKVEAASNEIEKELIKLTASSNVSKASAEGNSVHSSMVSRSQTIKVEAAAVVGPMSTRSIDSSASR